MGAAAIRDSSQWSMTWTPVSSLNLPQFKNTMNECITCFHWQSPNLFFQIPQNLAAPLESIDTCRDTTCVLLPVNEPRATHARIFCFAWFGFALSEKYKLLEFPETIRVAADHPGRAL
ncbi:hypothetical protein OIU76_011314 [Salix suchowensis]|nr:hypothetical protein OIU76_011314 [Salix suchowensis]